MQMYAKYGIREQSIQYRVYVETVKERARKREREGTSAGSHSW